MGKVDENLADKAKAINDYMLKNPKALRSQVVKGSGVNLWSCKKLEKLGMVKLPAPITPSMAATLGRSRQKDNFRLRGTPVSNQKKPPTFIPGVDYR